MTQWQALGATAAGMGFFAALYGVAAYADKASTVPYVRRLITLGCRACSYSDGSAQGCSAALRSRSVSSATSQMTVRSAQAPREYPYDDLKSEMGGEQRKL